MICLCVVGFVDCVVFDVSGDSICYLFGGVLLAVAVVMRVVLLAAYCNTLFMFFAGTNPSLTSSLFPNLHESVHSLVSGSMDKEVNELIEGTSQEVTSDV